MSGKKGYFLSKHRNYKTKYVDHGVETSLSFVAKGTNVYNFRTNSRIELPGDGYRMSSEKASQTTYYKDGKWIEITNMD
jgi:hypothetical protein